MEALNTRETHTGRHGNAGGRHNSSFKLLVSESDSESAPPLDTPPTGRLSVTRTTVTPGPTRRRTAAKLVSRT
jgi:hypothetical protein